MYPFERFTAGAQQALTRAQQEAVEAKQSYIGTEHLGLALIQDDGIAGRVLSDLGITDESMRAQIRRILHRTERPAPPWIIPTSRMKRVIEIAFQEATSAGSAEVGTEHLLAALIVEGEGVAARVLEELGTTLPKVRRRIRAVLDDRAVLQAGIIDAVALRGPARSGIAVGTSSAIGPVLLRAGQFAREEGATDIRADHLVRAIAEIDTDDLRGVLLKLGLAPQIVAVALTVPDEVRRLGLAAQRARVERAADYAAGGDAATQAVQDAIRLGRDHAEAVTRWLAESDV